jgi:AcrR family transcriptional regulator
MLFLKRRFRILPKVGSRNVTTKKIADLAGVSIGSLYQYFPNKESVLAALMDMAMNAKVEEFWKKIEEIDGQSMDESTSTMVDFALDLFLKEKEKIREIYLQAPELGRIPALLKLRQSVVERLAEEMKKHHPGKEAEEYTRVSFVAVNSIMGVIHTMLYDNQQNHTAEQLSFELKTMLHAYFHERTRNE